jgi:light-harvesting complex I chlorophyll a/b binding protein 1
MAVSLASAHFAFQAPALAPMTRRAAVNMKFAEGDVGVTPPLGVWDPLGLIEKRDMRRYEIMEIKHGRAAMLGFLHVILIHAGVRFPGYLSPTNDLKFADMPVGCFASLEAVPTAGWFAIMLTTCMTETGASARRHAHAQPP